MNEIKDLMDKVRILVDAIAATQPPVGDDVSTATEAVWEAHQVLDAALAAAKANPWPKPVGLGTRR